MNRDAQYGAVLTKWFALFLGHMICRTLTIHFVDSRIEGAKMSIPDCLKCFFLNKAANTVLTLASLMALASPVQAGVFLPLTFSPTSTVVSSQDDATSHALVSTTSNLTQTSLPLSNGVQGVSGSGNATLTNTSAGNWTLFYQMAGNVTGNITGSPIPLHWLFTVGDPTQALIDWNISVYFNHGLTPVTLTPNPSNPSGSFSQTSNTISGDALIPVTSAITSYAVLLQLNPDASNNCCTVGTFTLNVPAGSSIDINSLSATSSAVVPEPSAVVLVMLGLAFLIVGFKRAKQFA
jgi:hypothetical protein